MKTKLPKRQASPTPKVERAATYNTREISLDQKRRLLEEARKLSYNIWVDILDCKKSFARERIDMVWDEIMAKFNGECFFYSYPPAEPRRTGSFGSVLPHHVHAGLLSLGFGRYEESQSHC
jgi:hypothetical protein